MVKNNVCITGWVTSEASRTLISVPPYPIVLVVRFRICVAGRTGVFGIIGGIRMAIYTGRPLPLVLAAVNRKMLPVVVECRRHPARFRMAGLAVCGKLERRMAGVRRLGIICRMAAEAGVRGIVVIAVVAGGTVVGNGCVRTIKRIIVVVDGESRRHPIRRGGMTRSAIRREIQRQVVRIGALVVIRRMATCTGIWRIGIIPVVAGHTIIRDGHVRPGERVDCIVIKS